MFFILQAIVVVFFGVFMDWSSPTDTHSGSLALKSYSQLYFLYIGLDFSYFFPVDLRRLLRNSHHDIQSVGY